MTPRTGGRFLAFGEIMLRLSPPGRELLMQTPKLDVWVAGAEANVATQLARLGHDPAQILDRLAQFIERGTLPTIAGTELALEADSILVHGDTPGSVEIARQVRARLEASGALIRPLREVLAARSA